MNLCNGKIEVSPWKVLGCFGKQRENVLLFADALAQMASVCTEKHLACNVYETKSFRAPKTQLSDKFPFWIVSIFECTWTHIQPALKT